MTTLREFTDKDLPLFARWLQQDYVKRWFKDPAAWLEEVTRREDLYAFIRHYIVQHDGVDMGFCQYYDYALGGEKWYGNRDAAGTFSVDYLIGEPAYLGRQLAGQMIAALEKEILREPGARQIIVQPEKENIPSRRTLLAAGYSYEENSDVFLKRIEER